MHDIRADIAWISIRNEIDVVLYFRNVGVSVILVNLDYFSYQEFT